MASLADRERATRVAHWIGCLGGYLQGLAVPRLWRRVLHLVCGGRVSLSRRTGGAPSSFHSLDGAIREKGGAEAVGKAWLPLVGAAVEAKVREL